MTLSTTYAPVATRPEGLTAHGTTLNCGKWLKAQEGDICHRISLKNAITVDMFKAINPSINADCSNIIPQLHYCVQPTIDWQSTANFSANATVPFQSAPSASATSGTGVCSQRHRVNKGDTCWLIGQSYGISLQQLQSWNAGLKDDCSNLIIGNP